eukprot:m.55219 g.55219  ORF g.55219 m.55219 type:complete len:88 (-) comp11471_c1_seq1:94-357(-)
MKSSPVIRPLAMTLSVGCKATSNTSSSKTISGGVVILNGDTLSTLLVVCSYTMRANITHEEDSEQWNHWLRASAERDGYNGTESGKR